MHFQIQVPLFIVLMLMVSWVSCQDCGTVKFQELHGEFMSPNYPKEYHHTADCSWVITAPEGHFIQVTFEKFDVKNPFWSCTEDYVTVVYDKQHSDKFCNDEQPPAVIKSTTNTLTFQLKTDRFFSNGVGFKAEYYVVDKFGNRIAGDDEDVENSDTDSTSSAKPTMTTKASTTAKTTTTTKSTTTKTTKSPKTTSILVSKLTSSMGTKGTSTTPSVGVAGSNDGISSNPGAMTGVLIGVIIGCVFGIILIVAFVRYRRNKNKRIDLSVIEVEDGKELISDDKIYKKQGKKIVRVPEAETFPL